jgi:hypothetical protein
MEPEIEKMYNEFNHEGNYRKDKDTLTNLDFDELYSTGTPDKDIEVINNMHRIIKFIAYIDYIVKKIKKPVTNRDYPQMIDILTYLHGNSYADSNIDDLETFWKHRIKYLNVFSTAKYKAIIPIFSHLTRDPQKRNLVSKAAIEKNIKNEAIFNIDSNTNINQFNQTNTTWIPTIISMEERSEMRKRKTTPNNNCNKPCHPENKDDCCQRITKKVLNMFGIKYGGNSKHKNKRSKKNNKTRKNNKRT